MQMISRSILIGTALLVVVLDLRVCLSQEQADPESTSPEQVQIEINRLQDEILAWKDSKDAPTQWKQFQEAERQYFERYWVENNEWRALDQQRENLERTKEVQEWRLRFAKLEERLRELQPIARNQTRTAGVRLFQARHAELTKRLTKTPELAALGLNVLNYPRIDGSTSTQPLAVLITCHCFGASHEWKGKEQYRAEVLSKHPFQKFFLEGLTEADADLVEFSLKAKPGPQTTERLSVIINHLLATNASTNQAYLNLIDGRSELGLLARRPSDNELKQALDANVELDVQACALDAFVFLVNDANPVNNLTLRQVQDIYAGKLKNWSEVGGAAQTITAYQRETDSGSQELMIKLVMKDIPIKQSNDHREQLIGWLMSSPFLQLTDNIHGIGYSVHYYERFMSGSPRTRTIQVDGVEPNSETIATRQYPLVTEVFVVTQKGLPAHSPTARLRAWLLSAEGQAVVRESGYVPLQVP